MGFAFSQAELDTMRDVQEGHMMDTCMILHAGEGTKNEFNEDVAGEPTREVSICGLDMRPSNMRQTPQMTIIQYDATLRLPISASIKETDRVEITHRFGEPVEGLVYDVASPIQRGPSGIRVQLRKVVV